MAEFQSYTMNFGPQHPAAHGVLRLVLEMDGRGGPASGPAHRASAPGHGKAGGIQALQPGVSATWNRLDYVSMMANEHGLRIGYREASRHQTADPCPLYPGDVRRDHPNPQSPPVAGLPWPGRGRHDHLLVLFSRARESHGLLRGGFGLRACTLPTTGRGGVYRDLPEVMPRHLAQPEPQGASPLVTRQWMKAARAPCWISSSISLIVSPPRWTSTRRC